MSTTPSERKALLFLASLLTLGAVARMVNAAHRGDTPGTGNPASLARQIAAVDSERQRAHERRRASTRRAPRPAARSRRAKPRLDSAVIVDVDRASAAELDALPRIGPTLAQRIVKDREENGPYGSLDALTRVNGIGPKLVTYLAAHVTFSGSARPPTALSVSPGAVPRLGRSPPPG